ERLSNPCPAQTKLRGRRDSVHHACTEPDTGGRFVLRNPAEDIRRSRARCADSASEIVHACEAGCCSPRAHGMIVTSRSLASTCCPGVTRSFVTRPEIGARRWVGFLM